MIVNKDQYIINCINYIELNPVRAQIIEYPDDYRWSSYKDRVFNKKSAFLDVIRI
jgi:putative transposase